MKLTSFSSFSATIHRIGAMIRGDDLCAPSGKAPASPSPSKQTPAENHAEREQATAQATKGRSRFFSAIKRFGEGGKQAGGTPYASVLARQYAPSKILDKADKKASKKEKNQVVRPPYAGVLARQYAPLQGTGKMMETQTIAPVVAVHSTAFNAIPAGSVENALRSQTAKLGGSTKELLATVIKADNKKRFSFERPDFAVYRADVKGRSVTLLVKQVQGQVTRVEAASKLDRLFAHFPVQERRYAQLEKEGWKFRSGTPGGGTYCMFHSKEIFIDPKMTGNVFALMRALTHEMAHAVYKLGKHNNEEEYVKERLRDEGNAMLAECTLLDEATSEFAKSGIRKSLSKAADYKKALVHHTQWKHDRSKAPDPERVRKVDEEARDRCGEICRRASGSTAPDGSNYEMGWRINYCNWNEKPALIAGLQNQKSAIGIRDTSGKQARPSFENVKIVRRLPIQLGLQEPKIIFIDKDAFAQQAKGMELEYFEDIVKNGLDYGPLVGSVAVMPSPRNADFQRVTCTYKKSKVLHAVHLDFDNSGRVFNVDVAISPKKRFF